MMKTLCPWLALLGTLGCSAESDAPLSSVDGRQKVSIALNWLPDAQHGGFYASKVHKLYDGEGLDATILPGGPNAPVIQQVATKRADFGISNADDILMARQQGADVVAVLAIMQNNPRCIMVRADSGITRLDQLRNIKLAAGAGKAFVSFLAAKLPLENVTIVPYTGSISPFLNDPNLAQQAYVFSEPFVAHARGVDTRCLMVSDLGFNPYCSCLIVHGDTVRQNPDLVRKMVRATRSGWQRYLASPDQTNKVIQADNPEMSLESLAFGAKAIRQLCLPDGVSMNQLGAMTLERWHQVARQLVALGFVESSTKADDAFTTEFLN
jgi:NitT/TauT family transport system substrate-binding protein